VAEFLERWRWYLVALIAAPALVGVGMLLEEELDSPDPLVIESGELQSSDIRVYVAGAVQAPGVYPLAENSRWIDAVQAAGGATAEADLTAINLSRHALDEDHIIVPAIGGAAVAGASQQPLVNINSAPESLLQTLPGIGEVRAGAIVQSRTVDGPFGAPEDLLARELIPSSVFEDIAPLITVY
jgi:competence protein ComEA